jgi:hypothetical protein
MANKAIKKSKKNWYIKKGQKRYKKAKKFEKKNGFRFEDCWSLDSAVAMFILPRLIYLRDNSNGFSVISEVVKYKDDGVNIANEDDCAAAWSNVLNTMINGFYLYIVKDSIFWNEKEKSLWKETLNLFTKHFSSLWD